MLPSSYRIGLSEKHRGLHVLSCGRPSCKLDESAS